MEKFEMMDYIIKYQLREITTAQIAKYLDDYTDSVQKAARKRKKKVEPLETIFLSLKRGNKKVTITAYSVEELTAKHERFYPDWVVDTDEKLGVGYKAAVRAIKGLSVRGNIIS